MQRWEETRNETYYIWETGSGLVTSEFEHGTKFIDSWKSCGSDSGGLP